MQSNDVSCQVEIGSPLKDLMFEDGLGAHIFRGFCMEGKSCWMILSSLAVKKTSSKKPAHSVRSRFSQAALQIICLV